MRRRVATVIILAFIAFAAIQKPVTHGLINAVGTPHAGFNAQNDTFDCILELFKATNKGSSEVGTLMDLAEVYALFGQREKATQLMIRARNQAEAEKDRRPNFPTRTPSLDDAPRILTAGYRRIGAYDDAIKSAETIADPSLKASHLADIAAEMVTGGDKEKITGLLTRALKAINYSADESWVLASISNVYARVGDCEQARRIALSITNRFPHAKAPALIRVASECAKAGFKEKAAQAASASIRVAGLIKLDLFSGERYEVLAQAASAQIESGEKDKALLLLARALAGARKVEFNMRALQAIADAYASAQLYEKAKEVANSINFKPSRAEALLKIARRYISSGDKASAINLLDQSLIMTVDDQISSARVKFGMLADIAVEYANVSRTDRANEVLVESLRELRRHEYEHSDLLLSLFMAYAKSKLTPDDTARRLIERLCSGEAFELTPEEAAKQRRVEEAADRFIDRWHQTLDMNLLFDELYVSNPKQRQKNVRMFYGVYNFLTGSDGPAVDKNIDDPLLRDAFFTFWNLWYLMGEYHLAYWKPGDRESTVPPEIKKQPLAYRRPELNEKRMSRMQVERYIARTKEVLPVYRRYLAPEVFKTERYLDNLKGQEDERRKHQKPFRINPGFPGFDVPNKVEVYYLRKGVFEFYFIEEDGKLKVLTLGFEL